MGTISMSFVFCHNFSWIQLIVLNMVLVGQIVSRRWVPENCPLPLKVPIAHTALPCTTAL
jgi:hypothetical protein